MFYSAGKQIKNEKIGHKTLQINSYLELGTNSVKLLKI